MTVELADLERALAELADSLEFPAASDIMPERHRRARPARIGHAAGPASRRPPCAGARRRGHRHRRRRARGQPASPAGGGGPAGHRWRRHPYERHDPGDSDDDPVHVAIELSIDVSVDPPSTAGPPGSIDVEDGRRPSASRRPSRRRSVRPRRSPWPMAASPSSGRRRPATDLPGSARCSRSSGVGWRSRCSRRSWDREPPTSGSASAGGRASG